MVLTVLQLGQEFRSWHKSSGDGLDQLLIVGDEYPWNYAYSTGGFRHAIDRASDHLSSKAVGTFPSQVISAS